MATKITNVYVKNRAAGETSFKEVDSVYAGGTRVFKKASAANTITPEGIIPLKYVSESSYALYTQDEIGSKYPPSCFGVLLTPVQYKGDLYEPDTSSGWLKLEVYAGSNTTTHQLPIQGTSGPWHVAYKEIPDQGGAIFAPTLSDTLYLIPFTNFSFNRVQHCYLCYASYPALGADSSYNMVYANKTEQGLGPSVIRVITNYSPIISHKFKSVRESTGITLSGFSNLYVN